METVKTIKGVDQEIWAEFKSLAAKNNVPVGKLFRHLVEEYQKNQSNEWKDILSMGKILSNQEAKEIENEVKRIRSERGFRNL